MPNPGTPRRRSFGVVAAIAVALATLVIGVYAVPPEMKMTMAQNLGRRLAGLRLGSVEANGIRIPYLVGGEGEALVLLHGFGGDKDHWTRFARGLTDSYRVIAPDLPGFGETVRDPAVRYDVPSQIERLHAFLAAIGVDSFHLAGNSMGGAIAARYAAAHPKQVKSLILFAPGGVTTAQPSELQKMWESGRNPLLVESPEGFADLMKFVFAEPPWIPQSMLTYLAARAIHDRPFQQKIMEDLRSDLETLEKAMPSVKAPVLVIWGEQDRLVHVSGAEVIHKLVPSAKVEVMAGVGHCPMLEKPDETAKMFRDFRTATAS